MPQHPVIELEHVDAGYPGVRILQDVSFSVEKGEIFVLLGGSGCGKSSLVASSKRGYAFVSTDETSLAVR